CHAENCAISAQILFKNAPIAPSLLHTVLAIPKPPRETVERGREVAAIRAEGKAESLRRHFLLCGRLEVSECAHAAQLLVACAGEESIRRLGEQRLQLGRVGAAAHGEQA